MKKRISLLLVLLLCVLMAVSISAEEAFDWQALEQSYYEGTSPFISDVQSFTKNKNNNRDSRVDYSIAVERFGLKYDMLSPDAVGEKERFAAEFVGGASLWDMAESSGVLYAPFFDENGEGTAIISKDGTYEQAFGGDGGNKYKLVLVTELKNSLLQSNLKLTDTKLYHLFVPDICSGVLFTDGASEYYYVQVSNFASIKEGTLYAAADLVDAIVKEENIKPAQPVVLTYDENGELIPPDTGMGGAEDNASPGFDWLVVPIVLGALLLVAGLVVMIKRRMAKR